MTGSNYFKKRFAIGCLIFLTLGLFFMKIPFVLNDPVFEGDSGLRMFHANKIIFNAGNRRWLPFLQLHIWFFYQLKAPYWAFKLIPCSYFFLAVFFLGLLAYKQLGKNLSSLMFSLCLMFCFAYQTIIIFTGVNLYQEILELAFLYILLYIGVLDLRKNLLLLIIASIALLTRDTFQFYLLILTMLNYKKIISDRKYVFTFIWLWLIPFFWSIWLPIMSLVQGKGWPRWPLEWPLMENANGLGFFDFWFNSKSIVMAMRSNKIHFFLIGLIIAWAVQFLYFKIKKNKITRVDAFEAKFKIFSLSSLVIFYFLVWVINPWHDLYGNIRIGVVLFSHLFVWFILFYKKTFDYPKALKIFVRIVLIFTLFFTMQRNVASWFVKDYSVLKKIYARMEKLEKEVYSNDKPRICVAGNMAAVTGVIPFILYKDRKFVPDGCVNCAEDCDIVIKPEYSKYENEKLLRYAEFYKTGVVYTIYSKRISR